MSESPAFLCCSLAVLSLGLAHGSPEVGREIFLAAGLSHLPGHSGYLEHAPISRIGITSSLPCLRIRPPTTVSPPSSEEHFLKRQPIPRPFPGSPEALPTEISAVDTDGVTP